MLNCSGGLYEAISSLTPAQARRVHARYMLGMKVKDIAAMEGITPSQAGKSIHAALRAAAPVLHAPETDKRPMKTINLKKYYYPICKKDTFVEVPDEVADAIVEESRAEDANDAKQHYHCYSLDASPGMENHFPEQVISPEDILMEKDRNGNRRPPRALMMERLREALATLTPRQASCLHARFWEGKPFKEIAEAEALPHRRPLSRYATPSSSCKNIILSAAGWSRQREKAICTKTAPPKRNRKRTSAKKS